MKLYLAFVASIILGMLPSCSDDSYTQEYYQVSKGEWEKLEAKAQLKVLALGNSFTIDAFRYLPDLMNEAGEDDVLIAMLPKAGASLKTHWNNHLEGASVYDDLQFVSHGSIVHRNINTVDGALAAADWDIIVFQQASHYSGLPDSYQPYLDDLITLVKETNTMPRICFHLTWAYSDNSDQEAFRLFDNDRHKMHEAIVDAATRQADRFDLVIPAGLMIEEMRDGPFDTNGFGLTRDGFHLDFGFSCFALSCLWHDVLIAPVTGHRATDSRLRPNRGMIHVTDEAADYMFPIIERYSASSTLPQ